MSAPKDKRGRDGILPGLLKGMATTAKSVMRPTHTAEYPHAEEVLCHRRRVDRGPFDGPTRCAPHEGDEDRPEEHRDGGATEGATDPARPTDGVGGVRPDRGAGDHEGEEDEHDDRADVDEHEHERHQLGPQDEQ